MYEIYAHDRDIPIDEDDDGWLRFYFNNDETWFMYIVPNPAHKPDADNNITITLKYFMHFNLMDWDDQWYIPMVMGTMVAFDGDMWRKYYIKHEDGI